MTALLAKLRREPVAFWGGLLSALLVVLTSCGVDADLIGLIGTAATLVGIPIVRAKVAPVAPKPNDAGHAPVDLILIAVLVIVVLLLFGVTIHH